MARNELLVARRPDVHMQYLAFQSELEATGLTLHEVIHRRIKTLGEGAVRAALWQDQYPANVRPGDDGLPALHYNLWLRTEGSVPDYEAGDEVLARLKDRDQAREVYCFKRPPTQSIPQADGFPFEHAHVFTTAIAPTETTVISERRLF